MPKAVNISYNLMRKYACQCEKNIIPDIAWTIRHVCNHQSETDLLFLTKRAVLCGTCPKTRPSHKQTISAKIAHSWKMVSSEATHDQSNNWLVFSIHSKSSQKSATPIVLVKIPNHPNTDETTYLNIKNDVTFQGLTSCLLQSPAHVPRWQRPARESRRSNAPRQKACRTKAWVKNQWCRFVVCLLVSLLSRICLRHTDKNEPYSLNNGSYDGKTNKTP